MPATAVGVRSVTDFTRSAALVSSPRLAANAKAQRRVVEMPDAHAIVNEQSACRPDRVASSR